MLAFTFANLKMMARNRQATFWALFFPLLLVVVFGLLDIKGVGSPNLVLVDQADTDASKLLRDELAAIEFLGLEDAQISESAARGRVADGDLDYLVIIPPGFVDLSSRDTTIVPIPVTFLYNTRDAQRNQLVDGVVRNLVAKVQPANLSAEQALPVVSIEILVPEVSYFDSVLMGLMALGIMTSAIISIPVRISTYRNQSILKRLLVTPLPIWKYFASEITAHLVLAMVQAAIILSVGVFVFGAKIHGNPAWLFVIVPLGSLVFLNIGFILSAWARTPAAASGMGNAVVLPMMFFAGTFFSTDTFPWIFPDLAEGLPLTPMLSALRQVAIDGAPLWETWPQLAILAGWAAGTAVVAAKVFRFS